MMDYAELIEVIECIPTYEDLHQSYINNLQLTLNNMQQREEVFRLKDEFLQKRLYKINELIKDIEDNCIDEADEDCSDEFSEVEVLSDIQEHEVYHNKFKINENKNVKLIASNEAMKETTVANMVSAEDVVRRVVVCNKEPLSIKVPWYSPIHRPLLASPTSKDLLEEIQSPLSPPVLELNSTTSSTWSLQSPLIRYARNNVKRDFSDSSSVSGHTVDEDMTKSLISVGSNFIPSLNSNPIAYDEVFWEFRYQSSCSTSYSSVTHSKLFFFLESLWRITFGPHPSDPSYYFIYLSPGEHFRNDVYIHAAFHVLPCSLTPEQIPTEGTLTPFISIPEKLYHYPIGRSVSFGFDRFIHRAALLPYISPHGRLRLCLNIQAFEPLQNK